jgi:hypothetical protein
LLIFREKLGLTCGGRSQGVHAMPVRKTKFEAQMEAAKQEAVAISFTHHRNVPRNRDAFSFVNGGVMISGSQTH